MELCQLRGHQAFAAGPAVEPVTPSAESIEVGEEIAEVPPHIVKDVSVCIYICIYIYIYIGL